MCSIDPVQEIGYKIEGQDINLLPPDWISLSDDNSLVRYNAPLYERSNNLHSFNITASADGRDYKSYRVEFRVEQCKIKN